MYRMTDEEFEAVIEDALATIPERFLKALENIQIVVQDEPDPEQLACLDYEDYEDYDDELDGGGFEGAEFEDGDFEPDKPGNTEFEGGEDDLGDEPGELFGLYEGIALTERDEYGWCEVPDVITIFKGPHERCFDTREQMVEEVGKTVIHEIGHYFGLDDEKLYAMGY